MTGPSSNGLFCRRASSHGSLNPGLNPGTPWLGRCFGFDAHHSCFCSPEETVTDMMMRRCASYCRPQARQTAPNKVRATWSGAPPSQIRGAAKQAASFPPNEASSRKAVLRCQTITPEIAGEIDSYVHRLRLEAPVSDSLIGPRSCPQWCDHGLSKRPIDS